MQTQTNKQTYECQQHHKKIQYFCTINQWHFIPLCSQCLPNHTQNHPKNLKVTIEGVESVNKKYQQQQLTAIKLYQQKQAEIKELIKNPKENKQYALIEKTRNQLKAFIDRYFDKLLMEFEKKRKDTQQYQIELLNKLSSNISADLIDLKTISQLKKVNEWAQRAKRIYFKDGAQYYIDEIDDILKDHVQRVYETKELMYDETKIKKIEDQLKISLKSLISLYLQKPKEQKKIEETKKKVGKPIVKPKICKSCGSELQYLTEWKKHLVCPNCGGKQRNYIKKK